MSFIKHSVVTARKRHVCCECRTPIWVGEKYAYFAGLSADGGDFFTMKSCLVCHELRGLYEDTLDHGDWWYKGDLRDHLSDSGMSELLKRFDDNQAARQAALAAPAEPTP